ncbi:MAG: Transcriptional regulator [Pedosphaera sp.]|nr:Transcriptional regulator [Pedosphaera sp.]
MHYTHIRHADLNLLRILHALLEERHITRAAEICALSQPAMSRALDRLRAMFKDDLLIRTARGYVRTTRAERLLLELESLLPRLESLIGGENFDPARSTDRFRVTMTDNASVVLLPRLVARLGKLAPNIRLELAAWHDGRFADVEAGKVDVVLDVAGAPTSLESEVLFEEDFVCLVSSRHSMKKSRFTMAQYLKYPHAVVNVLAGQQTLVDRPLGDLGLHRRVALVVPFFVPAALATVDTPLILTVPRRLAKTVVKLAPLRMVGAPPELKGYLYVMAWHPRTSSDSAQLWFREQLRTVARAL